MRLSATSRTSHREPELDGDDVQGIAVGIGARVSALAEPAQVLVSSTVKDLVAGSGLSSKTAASYEPKWDVVPGAGGR